MLEKLKNQLLECNKELSKTLKELDELTNNAEYSKSHYELVMKLCDESIKAVEKCRTASNNITEFLENPNYFECFVSDQIKQKIIDHLLDGPEIFDETEDTVLDLKNMYKDKFKKKQKELLSLDVHHRVFMFYTGQADPSIMEITF